MNNNSLVQPIMIFKEVRKFAKIQRELPYLRETWKSDIQGGILYVGEIQSFRGDL